MATSTYPLKRRYLILTAASSHSDEEHSEQSHCSSNAASSDANSSDVTQQVAKASAEISSSSRGCLAQSKAIHETRRRSVTCYLDIRDVKQTTNPTTTKANFQKAVWTDEKHCSYLNSMEAAFLRNFHDKDHYAGEYSVDMADHVDCLDDDCAESRPPNDNNAFENSEAFGSRSGYSEHLVEKVPEPCTVISNLVTSLCDKESNSKLSRCEGKASDAKCSVSFTDDHERKSQQTKKRRVAIEQEFLDLELRLGDLRTRDFHRFYTPTFV
ncbi:hypothetical protein O6H91_13G078200 [Diphasiastrum complanatum]|uniref:Uncharacterized protein n=1 Tax=Diphasiastrum complanatum TaxID=34168 RepID=A0ACC2BWA0_DIPCM|nr:hypothetical protein O6H91_13G078200 [Diphasiastrum complanatum]